MTTQFSSLYAYLRLLACQDTAQSIGVFFTTPPN